MDTALTIQTLGLVAAGVTGWWGCSRRLVNDRRWHFIASVLMTMASVAAAEWLQR